MRVGDLIQGLNVQVVRDHVPADPLNIRVCDLTEDSRTVLPGSLFIARKGLKADGRSFVTAAVEAGAVAILTDDPTLSAPPTPARGHEPVLVLTISPEEFLATIAEIAERFYGSPSSKLTVIGVTGTNGKTTTAYLMHQMLNSLGIRTGLIGTVVIDDGVEVAPATLTTPPALEVSRTLARMLEAGCEAAVMEVSSHSLDQHRVGAIHFRAGVFTNLTGDHLDYHKTMDNYAAAKAKLFERLPSGVDPSGGGVAVVNITDPSHSRMVRETKARVLRCTIDPPLPIRGGTAPDTVLSAKVIEASTAWTDVAFSGPWSLAHKRETASPAPLRVRLPLVGDFNVMNALEAFAALYGVYVDPAPKQTPRLTIDQLAQALAATHAPPGRLEPMTRDGDALSVFVDYAHTDDALKTVLTTLRKAMKRPPAGGEQPDTPAPQLWCVFGCGGDRDRTKRPRMGAAVAKLADRIVITSDNPRTEDPVAIIREIQAGLPAPLEPEKLTVEPDRERAIRLAIRSALPGDTVLIAGKGHENYQIYADPARPGSTITRHFDDREIARSALTTRGIEPRPEPKPISLPSSEEETEDDDLPMFLPTGSSPEKARADQ